MSKLLIPAVLLSLLAGALGARLGARQRALPDVSAEDPATTEAGERVATREPGAGSRPGPPAFVTEPQNIAVAGRPVSGDPLSPHYDPFDLQRGLNVPPADLFDAEPRDERWAPGAERLLRERIGAALKAITPLAAVSDLECHTLSCSIEVTAPEDHARSVTSLMSKSGYGDRCGLMNDGKNGSGETFVKYICLNRREVRDLAVMDRLIDERKRRLAERVKAARAAQAASNPPPSNKGTP